MPHQLVRTCFDCNEQWWRCTKLDVLPWVNGYSGIIEERILQLDFCHISSWGQFGPSCFDCNEQWWRCTKLEVLPWVNGYSGSIEERILQLDFCHISSWGQFGPSCFDCNEQWWRCTKLEVLPWVNGNSGSIEERILQMFRDFSLTSARLWPISITIIKVLGDLHYKIFV